MELNLEANIFPRYELTPGELPQIEKYLSDIPPMENFFLEAPLDQHPVATIAHAEFYDGREYSMGVVDDYQFVITRRFKIHGEWHVGGANGEILNVYTLISGLKRFLEDQLALRDSKA